jgi:hemolysin activation/secretion protein
LLNFTFGPEFGEFDDRMYTSLSFARGDYITNLGYWYFQVGEGGFFTNSGNFEQAMFQLRLKYFTNLYIIGRFKYRQFINFELTRGIKRLEDDRITINDKYGLRGFNEPNVVGQQRIVMNMETVVFSPWYFYGFRFSFYGYLDLALLGSESTNIITDDVYTGLGIGTRIKNERLVFPTFSFRIGFYPNLKDMPFSERLHFSGEPRLKPNNFYVTNPAMIEYQ